jgi:hypothetical protein
MKLIIVAGAEHCFYFSNEDKGLSVKEFNIMAN